MKLNAAIVFISSRTKCLKHSLKSLWDNYNNRYNYPVYVFYFDDVYDNYNIRQDIISECPDQTLVFRSVSYWVPDGLLESELFYNRKNLSYVRASFPKNRSGYLHMCHFNSNLYGYPGTYLEKYDFIMTHDDESGYNKVMPYDPFDVLKNSGKMMGAYFVGQRLKNGSPHQGHLDTRVGLWQFTKSFIENNDIKTDSYEINTLMRMTDANAEFNFHYLNWSDTYVINNEVFETDLWEKWINAVNDSHGIYKYRWGDNEIMSLFAHLYQGGFYKIPAIDDGYHDQGKFRYLQDIAPGTKK